MPLQALGMGIRSIRLASVGVIKMSRKPAPGDKIKVPDGLTDEVYSGIVVDLLSAQFTYELADGTIRYAFYNSDWKYQ